MYKYLIISLIFCSFFKNTDLYSQYRDPFSEKVQKKRVKKNNKRGLFVNKRNRNIKLKKGSDPFISNYDQKGTVGLDSDPFKSNRKSKYKPTGVDKDSFSKKQRNKTTKRKYNSRNKRVKESEKSRNNYIRIRYK